MSFTPIVVGTGLQAWNVLLQTQDAQKNVLRSSTQTSRAIDHFRDKYPRMETAHDLISDRTSLSVALGAFGLQDDLENKYFIKRILEDGTSDPRALSNLVSDRRYRELAEAFQFDDPSKANLNNIEQLISQYIDNQFTASVGDQNQDLRLASTLESKLQAIGERSISNDAKWFTIMGNPPLRSVFETAFRIPSLIGNLAIDDQLSIFKEQASKIFKTDNLNKISSDDQRSKLIERFFLQSQINSQSVLSSSSVALSILSK